MRGTSGTNPPSNGQRSADQSRQPEIASADSATKSSTVEETFASYIPASESPLEFTFKAVIPGVIFGIAFGAANAFLGLRAGLTISTSIPIAVLSVAAFRAMRSLGAGGTILEANLAQTIGSASSSIASGAIFTLPALFMWGMDPALGQMTMLAMAGGVLGVLFMVPLRRLLIDREHGRLPYPEGTACAQVLIANEVGGTRARNVFWGLGVGGLFGFLFKWLKPCPETIHVSIPLLPKAHVGMDASAALLGVGYILGPRVGGVMVGGGLLSSLVMIPIIAAWGAGRTEPLYPETAELIADMSASRIWSRYVRYIGAGAVAAAGLLTLARSVPTMIESFRIGLKQIRSELDETHQGEPRTSRDLSIRVVGAGVLLVVALLTIVPHIFGTIETSSMRLAAAVCVAVFAFFFVTVSSRIVGLVGQTSNPISGMTIAALLGTATVFRLIGWTDSTGMVATLTVGCVVAIAASISGDTSQDLKTGFLLGATPRRQQIGELLGVLTCALFVCMTIIMLDRAYELGSEKLPAPQATLMKLVIEGVLSGQLPWVLVGIGACIAVVVDLLRLPSLAFAVGVYLPVSTMVPVFIGGLLRWFVGLGGRGARERLERRERGILFGSGLVGGEGLLGVAIAAVVFYQKVTAADPGASHGLPLEIGQGWARFVADKLAWPAAVEIAPMLLSTLLVAGFLWIFARACRTPERRD